MKVYLDFLDLLNRLLLTFIINELFLFMCNNLLNIEGFYKLFQLHVVDKRVGN